MKYKNIQVDLIQDVLTKKKRFLIGEYDGKVAVSEGHVVWLIPENMFVVDKDKVERRWNFKDIFSSIIDADNLPYKGETLTVFSSREKKNFTLMKLGEHTYIDKNLVKYFENPIFAARDSLSPVFEGDWQNLVGLIIPVKRWWE